MRLPIRFVPAVALAALLAPDLAAQEWTRFRGPNGTGHSRSKDIPVRWTAQDFLWRVALPGESDSQPVIWGERIFVLSAQNEGRDRWILCLNKEDGRELWSKKYALSSYNKGRSPTFSSSSPAVDKDRVVACLVDPEQFLVKAWDHSGKELWTVNLGPFRSQHGHGASPMFYEDKVIVANDQDGPSFVAALDARTGRTVWKSPRRAAPEGTAYATPCIFRRDGGPAELLLTSRSHGISSLDPRTGQPRWEAVVFDKRAVASPVVVGDLVVGSCGQGGGRGNYLAAVRLGGRGDVTSTHQAYTIRTATPYVPTPLALGDRLYLLSDTGVASAVEASTGRVIWSERVGGNFFASPVLIDGKIYCPSKEGDCVVFEAADAYKLLARNPLGEGSHATPCVDGSRIYFKTFTHLVCVGAR